MAILMIGIQDSLLVLQSSNNYKIHECLKGTDPQTVEFDPQNPSRAYYGTLVMACGKLMMVDRLGTELEKMSVLM